MGALKNLWRWLNYRIDLLFQKPGSSVIFVVLFTTIFAVRAFLLCCTFCTHTPLGVQMIMGTVYYSFGDDDLAWGSAVFKAWCRSARDRSSLP
jgi:hypothetical protein